LILIPVVTNYLTIPADSLHDLLDAALVSMRQHDQRAQRQRLVTIAFPIREARLADTNSARDRLLIAIATDRAKVPADGSQSQLSIAIHYSDFNRN
jgi:hypothetical protein